MLDDDIEVEIKPDDVRMDVFRAGSAGGQHMQKNSTAVRLTHIPTGTVVICQNERSQSQNRQSAMRVLRGKLYDIELTRREEQTARLKGKHIEMGWGNQIRSYVLQPYQMVKDLRTGYEVGNPASVLDGNLDGFMEAWLKERGRRKRRRGVDCSKPGFIRKAGFLGQHDSQNLTKKNICSIIEPVLFRRQCLTIKCSEVEE